MKSVSNEYYQVTGVNGLYGLAERFDSIEAAIQGGKEMNEREVTLGYKPTEWIVVRTTWCKCCDDDGSFITENSSTTKLSIDGYL